MQYRDPFKTQPAWIAALASLATATPAIAQIVPDATLPNNSIVTPNGSSFTIDGGTTAGSNLFHSFSQFSIPTNTETFFNNATSIENIITRVTGSQISNIDGLIRANGTANLFLLNPNGIVFNENARLEIGGSFFGSTADSIEFADGLDFNATERAASQPPLLSVNVPIGLQFGSNPGNIEVRGTFQDTFEVPTIVNNEFESINVLDTLIFNWLNRPTNLVVAPGKTLALAGGNITVDGAQLFAPGGRVILGSVGPQSIIGIEPSGDFTYDRASNFQDIHLNHSATVNASGDGGGRLQFRGRQIRVTDDAVAIAYNLGDRSNTFSSIDIQADQLTLQEEAALSSAALGNGAAGNITFQVETLTLSDRTLVTAGSLSSNSSSGIAIQATDSISIINTSLISTFSVSSLGQKSGSIEIETRRLTLGNTGQISSSTGGFGQGGDIRIHASESITLQPGLFVALPSAPGALLSNGIFSTTEGDISDLGIGGDLIITTDRLTLNGAAISSSSTTGGQAGTVTIRVNSLEAIGFPGFPEFPGSRVEFTGILSDGFAEGPAGSVFVQSDDIALRDGGRLSVGNFDSGDAGTLTVVADTLTVEERGEIAAFTISGEGGNIVLETDTLVLRREGRIFTDAGSTDGGNITIQTGVLAALENSDITANAIEGRGGRVSITAEGIFGTEFRLRTTEQSDITASSDSGPEFSGIVEINTPDVDSSAGLVELNAETTDPSREIVEGCAADRGNTFTVTGRGGLPPNPTQLLRGRALWHDQRNLSAISNKNKQRLVEATNWIKHPNGQIELVAESQNQRDILNAARNLSNLSLRYLQAGELSKAAQTTAQGKQLLQQVSISPEAMSIQGSLLNTEGNIQLALGKTKVALETWEKAAHSYQLGQDKFGLLGARINQAQALQDLGLYRGAKRLLESVNQQLETAPNPLMKATSLQSLGVTLQALGELDKSREILQQSLAISQQVGAEESVSATLLGLGNTAKAKPTPETAIDFYQQAAVRANNSLEKAEALLNLLAVYVEEEKGDEARALLPEIKAEIERIPGSRDRLYALINLAESWRRLAADLEIAKLLQGAVKEARELSDERGEAIALSQLALIYQETGELITAQQLTEQSVLIAEGLGAQEIVARSQSQLGQILKQQGKVGESIIAYTNAVKEFESLRKDLVAISEDVQFDFRETVEPAYRELVSLLLRDNPSQAQLQAAVDLIEALQLAELDNFFRDTCLEVKPEQIDRIDATAAVIYPIILPESLEIIVLQREQPILHHHIKLSQTEVEDAILEMRRSMRLLALPIERSSASATLYNWLIRPFEEQLENNRIETLVFVLDGNLRNVPIAALYDRDKEEFLVEKYAIAFTPGLQLLKSQFLEPKKLQAFAAGISQSVQGFAALPAVEWELEKVSELIPSEELLNQEFTSVNLAKKTEETPFPIIHLATHGQFSSNRDETFILAWDEKIKITEFERLLRRRDRAESTPIELLVLSACQTATGDERAALGLAGVAVRSGARSTLATLWSVQDGSTAELIVEFYRQLTNPDITKAEALRRAQVALLKGKYKPPYFWAPFVLVGNWQ